MAASSASSSSSAFSAATVTSAQSKVCALFSSSSQTSSIKLDRGNYVLWESVVLSLIEGNKLESHINGTNPSSRFLASEGAEPTTLDEIAYELFLMSVEISLQHSFAQPSGNFRFEEENKVANTDRASMVNASTEQITSTTSSPTVGDVPRGIHSSASDFFSSEASDRAVDSIRSNLNSNSSSPNVGSSGRPHTSQAQNDSHSMHIATAQQRHPMVTRARDGIHKPRYPYVGLLQLEISPSFSTLCAEPRNFAPVTTPMVTGKQLSKEDGELLTDVTLYGQAVGSLQYLTTTRPDISFSGEDAKENASFTMAKVLLCMIKSSEKDVAI
ncbi:putative copia-type protein [Senna tora]|uniref:Putative copia-type protein n=1 Tax=Senna tora TaxID=362788 RepID=A0A835CHQ2_9FABA|nr:putative copia-type protein [Senna tora]